MKIAGATVQMDASHLKTQQYEVSESLRAWVGNRRAGSASLESSRTAVQQSAPQVQLSDAGKATQSSETDAIQQGLDDAEKDPKLILIRAMIAMLTGREVKVFDASEWRSSNTSVALQAPTQTASAQPAVSQNAGYGIEYDRSESYSETEATHFAASGVVKTSDGREISFSLELSMARSYAETSSVSVRAGDARQKQDPLVLNFNGTAAQLTGQRFKFDLNADGQAEDINFATGGSGFLALDRNGDGQINNGTELFGARSGDGFAELATLDADHNGWIDENDAAYDQLRVLSKDGNGNDQLATLRQANVGALSLDRVATPFDLKDSGNALQGQVRTSGVFLQEDGKAGTMQQIDLMA
jgi:hypothetical protein